MVAEVMGRSAVTSRGEALAAAYRAHAGDVFHVCLRYGSGRTGWAEDAVHDVFVRLAERINELDDRDDLGAWLYRVATNHCVSKLRREVSYLGRLRRFFEGPTHEENVVEHLEHAEQTEQVITVLDRLPPIERAVITMKFLDDQPQHTIAATLDLSEGYVSKLVKRACQRIREEGFEVDDEA